MKKSIQIVITSLLIPMMFFTSCSKKSNAKIELEPLTIDYVKDSTELFDLTVKPQQELFSIVLRLAGLEAFNNSGWLTETYISNVDTYFEKYKNEPVVKTAQNILKKNSNPQKLLTFGACIKEDFSGIECNVEKLPDAIVYAFKDIKPATLTLFVSQLNEFAHKTNFERFYLMNKSSYISNVAVVKDFIQKTEPEDKIKIEDWFKDFYSGYEVDRTTINISTINNGNCYYTSYDLPDSSVHNYVFFSAYSSKFAVLLYPNAIYGNKLMNELWPEYKDVFENYITKFKVKNNIASDLDTYMQFVSVVSDSLLSDFVGKNWNENEKDSWINNLEKNYLVEQISDIAAVADKYSSNRNVYKNFEDIIPELKELIKEL